MQNRKHLYLFLLLCLWQLFSYGQSVVPMDTASNEKVLFYQEGRASYYHNRFHGRKTASGVRYNKNKLTAAHLTLPLGTRVKVTNKRTGKWVIVIVNDRGPYSRRYQIDLSYRAAKHLGMTNGKGYARVVIEELPAKPQPWPQMHVPETPEKGLK